MSTILNNKYLRRTDAMILSEQIYRDTTGKLNISRFAAARKTQQISVEIGVFLP